MIHWAPTRVLHNQTQYLTVVRLSDTRQDREPSRTAPILLVLLLLLRTFLVKRSMSHAVLLNPPTFHHAFLNHLPAHHLLVSQGVSDSHHTVCISCCTRSAVCGQEGCLCIHIQQCTGQPLCHHPSPPSQQLLVSYRSVAEPMHTQPSTRLTSSHLTTSMEVC